MAAKIRKLNEGQALLEFALVVLIFPLIMFGIFDLGRIFQTQLVITNAAREGARYLVRNPDDNLDIFFGTIEATLREAESSAVTLIASDVNITACTDTDVPDDGCDSQSVVEVTVTKSFSFFFGDYLVGPLPLSSSARMLIP